MAPTLAFSEIADEWTTRSGFYRISYESEIDPLEINRIHDWVFFIKTPEGEPVSGASITLTGGMPEHNHGLPTAPRMTADLGSGRYRSTPHRRRPSG